MFIEHDFEKMFYWACESSPRRAVAGGGRGVVATDTRGEATVGMYRLLM